MDCNYYVVNEANNSLVYFQSGQYKGGNRLVAAYSSENKADVEAAVRCANNLLAAGVAPDDDYIFLDASLGCVDPTYAAGDSLDLRVLQDVYSEYVVAEETDVENIRMALASKLTSPLGCGSALYYDPSWILLAIRSPTSLGRKPMMLVCKKANMPKVEAVSAVSAEATL